MAHRVDTSTAIVVMPDPGAAGTPGFFSAGDPQTGTPATVPGFAFFNMIQEEVVNVVEDAGLTPDKADNTQLQQAIDAKIADALGGLPMSRFYATNAAAVTLSNSAEIVTTLDLGDVIAGDILLANGRLEISGKGTTAGNDQISIGRASGTAAIISLDNNSFPALSSYVQAGQGTHYLQISAVFIVTISGSLVFRLVGTSFGSDSTVNAGHGDLGVLWLKKQSI